MCNQQSLKSACAYAQSDQSHCLSLKYCMTLKLLAEHHLDFLSLKGGCTGSSEPTLVKCHIVGNHVSRLNFSLSSATGVLLANLTVCNHARALLPIRFSYKSLRSSSTNPLYITSNSQIVPYAVKDIWKN